MQISRALGVKWDRDDKPDILEPASGPTIAELTAGIQAPVAGGDTMAASRAILERLAAANSPQTLQ